MILVKMKGADVSPKGSTVNLKDCTFSLKIHENPNCVHQKYLHDDNLAADRI